MVPEMEENLISSKPSHWKYVSLFIYSFIYYFYVVAWRRIGKKQ